MPPLYLYLLTNYATKDLASFYIVASTDSITAFHVLATTLNVPRHDVRFAQMRTTKLGEAKKSVKEDCVLLAIDNVRTAFINPLIKTFTE